MAIIFEGRFCNVVKIDEDISRYLYGWEWDRNDIYIDGILSICNTDLDDTIQLISKSSPYGYLYYIDDEDRDCHIRIYRIEIFHGAIRKFLCKLTWDIHREVL